MDRPPPGHRRAAEHALARVRAVRRNCRSGGVCGNAEGRPDQARRRARARAVRAAAEPHRGVLPLLQWTCRGRSPVFSRPTI
jgi:hypothetical protein